jgi:hypothetical protein
MSSRALWFFTFFESKRVLIGAAFVFGRSFNEAHRQTSVHGCHPGGEVLARRLSAHHALCVPDDCRNRLLSRAELRPIVDMFERLTVAHLSVVPLC